MSRLCNYGVKAHLLDENWRGEKGWCLVVSRLRKGESYR